MAVSGGPDISEQGLVLYLDAGNTRSYVSGSTTWVDLSGNGNNGTLTNGPTFNSTNGGSIVFDGVNDFVTLGNISALGFTNGIFSVSTWLTIPSSWTGGSQYPNLVSKGASAGWDTAGWSMYIFRNRGSGTGYAIGFGMRSGSVVNNSGEVGNLPTNTPINAVITAGGINGQRRIYINAVNQGLSTQTINPESNSTNVLIGRDANSEYFPGQIYTTQIYNKELTAQEILQNYNAQRSRFGL